MIKWLKAKTGSLLSKTFIYMVTVALAVLLAVVGVLFLWFRSQMVSGYRKLISTSAANVDVVFDQYITTARGVLIQWFGSLDSTLLRMDEEYDYISNMSFITGIQKTISNMSYVQSVYFVDYQKQIPLLIAGTLEQTEDLDSLLVEKLEQRQMDGSNQAFAWNVKNRYRQGENIPLLTLYTWEAPLNSPQFTGAAAVNLNLEQMSKKLFSDNQEDGEHIFLINEAGMVIAHSAQEHIGENWYQQEYIRDILQGSSGFSVELEEERWEITALPSAQSGFYVVAKSKYVNQVANISNIIQVLTLIIVVAAVFVAVAMLLVSRHIFAPFSAMVDQLRDSRIIEQSETESLDEVKFLDRFYSDLAVQMDQLKQKTENDFIIKNLLVESRSVEIQQLMLRRGIVEPDGSYDMILLHMENKNDSGPQNMQEYDMHREMVSRLYQGMLEKLGRCTCFELGLRKMLFLVTQSAHEEKREPDYMQELQNAAVTLEQLSSTQIYAVLAHGEVGNDRGIAETYRHIEGILQTSLVLGSQLVHAAPDEGSAGQAEKLAEEAVRAVKDRKKKEYMEKIGALLERMSQSEYPEFILRMQETAVRILEVKRAGMTGDRSEIARRQDMEQQQEQLMHLESRENFMLWFEATYNEITIEINKVSNHSTVELMEEAVNYIRSNYDQCDLNVNALADKLGISPAYFGKLFQEFAGCKALEYIAKVRMEKAHDLLLSERSIEIADVAGAVGYSNSTYFSTVFKKYYGVTPSKLRDYNVTAKLRSEE